MNPCEWWENLLGSSQICSFRLVCLAEAVLKLSHPTWEFGANYVPAIADASEYRILDQLEFF